MLAQTRGCFLISNNKFKADGEIALHSLIQLSKSFDFRIPQLLFDFPRLSNSLARLIGSGQGGHQCRFWYRLSPLLNLPHLTMLIAAPLSAFDVKTCFDFFLSFFHHQFITTLCKGQRPTPCHVCIASFINKQLPACHEARPETAQSY